MTDLEAIKQYREASQYYEMFYDRPIPWVFARDPAIVARIKERDKKRMASAACVMRQAEMALNRLPRLEWREAMVNRYFLLRDHLATAEAMSYSETSVRRFERAAIEYLSRTNKGPAGRPLNGP